MAHQLIGARSRLSVDFSVHGRRIQICHAFLHTGVVDAQELVRTGLSCRHSTACPRALLIEELVYGFILRCQAQIGRHDLKQCFAQLRGASLRSRFAVADILAGVSGCGSTPAKPMRELPRGKLRISPISAISCAAVVLPYAIHGVNGFVFRQLLCKTSHLTAYNGNQLVHRSQLLSSRLAQQLRAAVFGQRNDMTEALDVNVSGLGSRKIVPHALAPLLVSLCECIFTDHADTLARPNDRDKVHYFS